MAGKYNFTIEQGDTFRRVLTWNDENGAPINLTGFSATLQAKQRKGDSTFVISLAVGTGITLGGSAGTITIVISSTATAAMTFRSAYYNLELTAPNYEVTRLLEGQITISGDL